MVLMGLLLNSNYNIYIEPRWSSGQPLERALAVREVLDSLSGRGGHKNRWGRKEPSDYVSFRRAVNRQRFHTIN